MSKPLEDAILAVEEFLKTVHEESAPLTKERQALHTYVLEAIHHLEQYLGWALDGGRLRGAHNLLTNENPIWGWNARKKEKHQKIRLPDVEGEEGIVEALFLSHDGLFTIAEVRLIPGGGPPFERARFELFEAEDDDFKVEDFPHCLRTVYIATHQHLSQSDKTAASTAKIRRLADETVIGLLNYRRWGAVQGDTNILKITDRQVAPVKNRAS